MLREKRKKRKDPDVATQTDKMWTNNNCESRKENAQKLTQLSSRSHPRL